MPTELLIEWSTYFEGKMSLQGHQNVYQWTDLLLYTPEENSMRTTPQKNKFLLNLWGFTRGQRSLSSRLKFHSWCEKFFFLSYNVLKKNEAVFSIAQSKVKLHSYQTYFLGQTNLFFDLFEKHLFQLVYQSLVTLKSK